MEYGSAPLAHPADQIRKWRVDSRRPRRLGSTCASRCANCAPSLKKLVSFGPRPTGSKAMVAQRAWLVQHFTKLGDEAFATSRFEDAEKHYGDVLDLDSSNEHARRRMQQIGAGETVEMTVIRGDERKTLQVELGERPTRRR